MKPSSPVAGYVQTSGGVAPVQVNATSGALLVDVSSSAVSTGLSLKAVSDPVTLGASATLQSLLAAVTGLARVVLVPSSDAVGYYAYDKAASGSTAKLPSVPFDRPMNAADYAKVRVYGTAGSIVIEQYA
jgi:hypothetical protein